MTWTLGIDTSHHVAVGIAQGDRIAAREIVADTRAHVEQLMPRVLLACAAAGITLTDIDDFAVGMGPGPFTGLRVGIATARTLAHAAGRPVHGVCSLDVVARQFADSGAPERFIVAADARRKELYWRIYRSDATPESEPQVTAPERLPDLPVAGDVPEQYRPLLNLSGPDSLDPGVLAAKWASLAPAGEEPYYLRQADATVPGRPKSALPRLRAR